MNYIQGTTIKKLREQQQLTQWQLAEKLCVSDKTISKWETGKGLPDISLIEPLAKALHISVVELFSGEQIINDNRCANIAKSKIYICPICGNVLHATGQAMISCCGVNLPALEAEKCNESHQIHCEKIEHELYVSLNHSMTKSHYISFIAYCTSDRFELVKLYPEGNAEARFFSRGHGILYAYCNHHGLFYKRV